MSGTAAGWRATGQPPTPTQRQAGQRETGARSAILTAASRVIARKGLAGLSYRSVAAEAGVSVALTSYHFPTKFDLVEAASAAILAEFRATFERALARLEGHGHPPRRFPAFVRKLLRNASRRDLVSTLSWAEISLDAVRHSNSLALACEWHAQLMHLWERTARVLGEELPRAAAQSSVDLVTGLLLVSSALDVAADILLDTALDSLPEDYRSPPLHAAALTKPAGPKALKTRDQLLEQAMRILVREGATAISYRAIASGAGLTTAAPAYHFPSIGGLLLAAQSRLFDRIQRRHREAMTLLLADDTTTARLLDIAATLCIREATEFRDENLAFFSIWVEAARRPDLRAMIRSVTMNQYAEWQRTVERLPGDTAADARAGRLAHALFQGKLFRILSTGSELTSLADVRNELKRDLLALRGRRFWI